MGKRKVYITGYPYNKVVEKYHYSEGNRSHYSESEANGSRKETEILKEQLNSKGIKV